MEASCHATYKSRWQSRLSHQTSKSPCLCGDSSPPEHHALPINDESGVEAIFRLFTRAMAFWERLKTCRPCLEAHTQRLLDMIENVLGFLSNSITDKTVNSVVAPENLPLMALGRFTLDGQQGATLISSIYRRILRQMASMLDEMQQLEHNQHVGWEQDLGDYLIPVLQLLEAIER